MPHTTAIQAFNGINHAQGGTLLAQLYGALVTIELLAKDKLLETTTNWRTGHNIFALMIEIDGSLSASCTQLQNNLVRLYCTDQTGACALVSATKYPHIRYLRHFNDDPPWPQASSDQMLLEALNDARLCLQQLKNLGVAP